MADKAPPSVTGAPVPYPIWYRIAATMIWENPAVTHRELARKCGRARETVSRAIHTKEFGQAMDDVAQPYLDQLVVGAHRGLLSAWARGRGSGPAISLLRSRGLIKPERVEVTGADGEPLVPTDLAEQIRSYAQRLVTGGTVKSPADPDQPPTEVAEPGTQGGARS